MESKDFLGINWKVRAKNPQFWLSIALSIIVPPCVYAGIELNSLTSWSKLFSVLVSGFANPYVVLMIIVSIYNSIVDKTTKGLGDSYIAKQYLKPRTDYDPKQALGWEIDLDKKADAKAQAKIEQEKKIQEEEREKLKEDVRKKEEDIKQRELEHQEKEKQLEEKKDKPVEEPEVVDGINGKEISNGDIQDEIELNNQTAEDTFGDIDNEIFGDSAEPQEIGNDTDEEYREKQADADIRGTDIRG